MALLYLYHPIYQMNRSGMPQKKDTSQNLSEFLQFLANQSRCEVEHLPTLAELSQTLGVSVASLREQLEVARALGLVEVKPRTGIRSLPYSFRPSIEQSLNFALAINPDYFQSFSDLRSHLEMAYWYQAVARLNQEDLGLLRDLVNRAQSRLRGNPIQIPHAEHRELHLVIYRRLENPFVMGLLEAYWDLYEAFGLDVYTDYSYLEQVWRYHQQLVDAICRGDYSTGYQALIEHMELLYRRSKQVTTQRFE
jgi:DNA-binding FadR family transcriptional regulator